jgi:hypothetical protein
MTAKPIQSELALGSSDVTRRANRVSKKASKARRKVRLPMLPMADGGFEPVEGVPKMRGDCPKTRLCPHVRCRFSLFMEDAAHRSGRPGLGSVPRDARGLTMSAPGDAGDKRPGTTLRPAWLRVRGMEAETEVKVYVSRDEDGAYVLGEVRNGTLDYWLSRLTDGDLIIAMREREDDKPEVLARGKLRADGAISFDRELPEDVVTSSDCVVLVRARPVASCALDLIDQHGKLTNEQTGEALARHRTLVGREVRSAVEKAKEIAADMGMSDDELLRGLRELGAQ